MTVEDKVLSHLVTGRIQIKMYSIVPTRGEDVQCPTTSDVYPCDDLPLEIYVLKVRLHLYSVRGL